jgi:hypothetical protein
MNANNTRSTTTLLRHKTKLARECLHPSGGLRGLGLKHEMRVAAVSLRSTFEFGGSWRLGLEGPKIGGG